MKELLTPEGYADVMGEDSGYEFVNAYGPY